VVEFFPPSLNSFSVFGCPFSNDQLLKIFGLPSLQKLKLNSNFVGPISDLFTSCKLTQLSLCSPDITSAEAVKILKNAKSLIWASFLGCSFPEQEMIMATMSLSHPNLENLICPKNFKIVFSGSKEQKWSGCFTHLNLPNPIWYFKQDKRMITVEASRLMPTAPFTVKFFSSFSGQTEINSRMNNQYFLTMSVDSTYKLIGEDDKNYYTENQVDYEFPSKNNTKFECGSFSVLTNGPQSMYQINVVDLKTSITWNRTTLQRHFQLFGVKVILPPQAVLPLDVIFPPGSNITAILPIALRIALIFIGSS